MESIVKARWGVLGAVLALALFLVVSTTLAQSGGGYDLSWSTVDGGGVPAAWPPPTPARFPGPAPRWGRPASGRVSALRQPANGP